MFAGTAAREIVSARSGETSSTLRPGTYKGERDDSSSESEKNGGETKGIKWLIRIAQAMQLDTPH